MHDSGLTVADDVVSGRPSGPTHQELLEAFRKIRDAGQLPKVTVTAWTARSPMSTAASVSCGRVWFPRRDLTPEPVAAPLMGWKIARLAVVDGDGVMRGDGVTRARFAGVGWCEPYDAVDRARCASGGAVHPGHRAPDPECVCGFYVLAHPPGHPVTDGILGGGFIGGGGDYSDRTAVMLRSVLLLRVEVWGRVIEHTDVTWEGRLSMLSGEPLKTATVGEVTGWRAEHQRVLDVYLDPVCGVCEVGGVDPGALRVTMSGSLRSGSDVGDVKVVCPGCLRKRREWGMVAADWTADQLAADLGVPVRWRQP